MNHPPRPGRAKGRATDGVAPRNRSPDDLLRLVAPCRLKATLERPLPIQRCELITSRNGEVILQGRERNRTRQSFWHRLIEIRLEKGAPVAPQRSPSRVLLSRKMDGLRFRELGITPNVYANVGLGGTIRTFQRDFDVVGSAVPRGKGEVDGSVINGPSGRGICGPDP